MKKIVYMEQELIIYIKDNLNRKYIGFYRYHNKNTIYWHDAGLFVTTPNNRDQTTVSIENLLKNEDSLYRLICFEFDKTKEYFEKVKRWNTRSWM